MSERDEKRHVAVGAGSSNDPDPRCDGDGGSDVSGCPPSPGDVVRAVAEFVDDLVEDAPPGHDDEQHPPPADADS